MIALGDLATRTGEAPEQLREWRALRLIGAEDREDFRPEDVERVRLIQFCLRRGVVIETIVRAEEDQQGFLRYYLDQLFPVGIPAEVSLPEAAAMTGLDVELVRRLRESVGAATPMGAAMDAADVDSLRGWKIALEGGLPEEALLPLVRVYADALGRVAEAEVRLFHFYVHERLRDGGLSGRELFDTSEAASAPTRRLIEPALAYFHRKGMEAALREDMLMHLDEYSGRVERREAPAQLTLAIAFLDLASFTPLTESMGDVAAAQVVERFSEVVREVVNRSHGRVVERIGDAFLLVFPDAAAAVACALEIDSRAADEAQFPAVRGGIHFGPVLYREGGYVGSNVNIASRVAGEAGRHQILVTAAVRQEGGAMPDVDFTPIGKRRLKGLSDELELFEARTRTTERPQTVIDPVCGMELTRAGVAARLSLDASERCFCSERCLRLFVESRDKYEKLEKKP